MKFFQQAEICEIEITDDDKQLLKLSDLSYTHQVVRVGFLKLDESYSLETF